MYTPCSKKVVHQAHIHNVVNSQRIFIIPSLAHSLENLRYNMKLNYASVIFINSLTTVAMCHTQGLW